MFIIAGERRSGTSTLAKWIEAHPDVYLNPKLDQAYFVDDVLRGRREWMDGKIDPAEWDKNHSREEYEKLLFDPNAKCIARGEKSADYFFWNPCLSRIKEITPEAKIILIFRNPVERAWSQYWNELGKGREWLSFEEAIKKEEERSQKSDYARHHLSYIERGKFVNSLNRWIEAFGRNNIHVVILEEMIKEPVQELKKVYSFLGVNPEMGLELAGKRFNNNWTTIPYAFWRKNKMLIKTESAINNLIKRFVKLAYSDVYKRRLMSPKLERITRFEQKQVSMNPQTREELHNLFEPFNQELSKVINNPLTAWSK